MTIPADTIIAQGQIVYRKTTPPGGQPTILTAKCNCPSSPKEQTSRFISQNRHLFITPEMFKDNQWA
jgi:hypothetical protein